MIPSNVRSKAAGTLTDPRSVSKVTYSCLLVRTGDVSDSRIKTRTAFPNYSTRVKVGKTID